MVWRSERLANRLESYLGGLTFDHGPKETALENEGQRQSLRLRQNLRTEEKKREPEVAKKTGRL